MQQYSDVAALASQHGAQIIVFPENNPYAYAEPTRRGMEAYSEPVPAVGVNPCQQRREYGHFIQTYGASCMAKNNSIVAVINMVDRVPCDKKESAVCPDDGFFLFNTDVVFGSSGAILAIYHKAHIYGASPILNQPAVPDNVTFEAFGVTFGIV
jgi:predicted amidohydrolase